MQPVLKAKYKSIYSRFLSLDETQVSISAGIESGQGFMISRLGSNEAKCAGEHFFKNSRFSKVSFDKMSREAGFFPAEKQALEQFSEMTRASLGVSDLLGVWNTDFQHQLLAEFASQSRFCELGSLEPFFSDMPWTQSLSGKRVLVVNPFETSIIRNYADRAELPLINRLLPEFHLTVLRPPLTLAGNIVNNSSWFDELARLRDQVQEINFDVAILGCGSYGMPLAAFVKELGRVAIHLGGSTQLLFGVKGARWASRKDFSEKFEGSWRFPDESERPSNFKAVEGGCYW